MSLQDNQIYGDGLRDLLDVQRQVNELDNLLYRQMLLSSNENPFERIRQIVAAQAEHRERISELIAQAKEV